jgi:GNAT superfamily N-acetyltransferase
MSWLNGGQRFRRSITTSGRPCVDRRKSLDVHGDVAVSPRNSNDDCVDIHRVQDRAIRGIQTGKPMGKDVAAYLEKREPDSCAKEMENECFVIVEDGEQVIGYGALHVPKNEITSVFVDPDHQRRGTGRIILTELEKLARRYGIEVVQLQATGTAILFYRAAGYQPDPPVGSDAEWAQMKKKLS